MEYWECSRLKENVVHCSIPILGIITPFLEMGRKVCRVRGVREAG